MANTTQSTFRGDNPQTADEEHLTQPNFYSCLSQNETNPEGLTTPPEIPPEMRVCPYYATSLGGRPPQPPNLSPSISPPHQSFIVSTEKGSSWNIVGNRGATSPQTIQPIVLIATDQTLLPTIDPNPQSPQDPPSLLDRQQGKDYSHPRLS